jgi:cytochrome c oxidase subunit 3
MIPILSFIKKKEKHHFHLVDNSSLPLLTSLSIFLLVCSFVFWFHPLDSTYWNYLDNILFQFAWISFLLVLLIWFITVLIESDAGHHTLIVRKGLRYGMALFIVSEVLFFFAFFWAFFHVSLAPAIAIGCVWPPKSVQSLDIWELPLTNTLLLLSSGFATTLAHKALWFTHRDESRTKFQTYLLVAIILGIIFLCCQMLEYKYGITFSWKENIYGSTFFVTTGFHGFHVTIGTIFLIFCFVRASDNIFKIARDQVWIDMENFYEDLHWVSRRFFAANPIKYRKSLKVRGLLLTKEQHLGFEAAAWYWHFVDVVWIFLFLTVYWWGSY